MILGFEKWHLIPNTGKSYDSDHRIGRGNGRTKPAGHEICTAFVVQLGACLTFRVQNLHLIMLAMNIPILGNHAGCSSCLVNICKPAWPCSSNLVLVQIWPSGTRRSKISNFWCYDTDFRNHMRFILPSEHEICMAFVAQLGACLTFGVQIVHLLMLYIYPFLQSCGLLILSGEHMEYLVHV